MDDGPLVVEPDAHGLPSHVRRVHFVGIGGIGMSGLAVMMSALGYEVTGSDLAASAVTADLLARGVEVQTGHDARWVGHADAVVTSAAIREENPEVQEARRRRLPVLRRGVMLAGLSRARSTVAVKFDANASRGLSLARIPDNVSSNGAVSGAICSAAGGGRTGEAGILPGLLVLGGRRLLGGRHIGLAWG